MPRLVHKATDGLSEHAWLVMKAGFAAKKTSQVIAKEVREQAGEKVAERTIARRGAEWRTEQNRQQLAREQVEHLIAGATKNDLASSQILTALATQALIDNPEPPTQKLGLEAEKVHLKRKALDLKERQVAIDEKKVAALEEKERKAQKLAEDIAKKVASGKSIEESKWVEYLRFNGLDPEKFKRKAAA